MTYRTSIALAGAFTFAATMAFAEDNQADVTAQYSDTDTYEIIERGQSSFYGGGHLVPCELDAQGEIQCTGPTFSQNVHYISALLYNQDHGGLVQCQFAKVEAEAGDEDVFAQYDPHLFVEKNPQFTHDYVQSVADMLRPDEDGVQNGVKTFGSCVPYETPLTDDQIDSVRSGTVQLPYSYHVLGIGGVDWDGPGSMFRVKGMFKDWDREDRLSTEYRRAHDAGSDVLRVIEHDFWGNGSKIDHYIHANAPACDNTGDFTMADAIWNAVREDTTVSGIKLRANCPAL